MSDHQWYYAEGSHAVGPVSLDELLAILSRVSDARDVLLWNPTLPHWEKARNVPEIFIPPPSYDATTNVTHKPPTPPLTSSLDIIPQSIAITSSAIHNAKKSRTNFIAKNWHGEFPLWMSYWVFGLLANIIAFAFAVVVQIVFTPSSGYNPLSVFAVLVTTWTGIGLIVVWQLVGIWRSANRQAERQRRAVWGVLAKIAVVLGTIRLLTEFAQSGYPQIREAGDIAFINDPSLPDYALRIMRGGSEIEVSGGFKYGLNDDLVRILNAAPQVKVVHLNSVGGRTGEAVKVFETIRERALTTYTSTRCYSACTLAFRGGRERWVHADAHLGYHRPSFPGTSELELRDAAEAWRSMMIQSGIALNFISRALSTPSTSMWEPTTDELKTANVINGVADPYKFAVSGYGSNTTRERMWTKFHEVRVYAALAKTNPNAYEQFIDLWHAGYIAGRSEGELIDEVRTKIYPIINSYRRFADDETIQEIGRLALAQLKALAAKIKNACYEYASGTSNDYITYLPPALVNQELDLNARVLETAHDSPKLDQKVLEENWKIIRSRLALRFREKLSVLDEKFLSRGQRADYCDVSVATYEEILQLPSSRALMLLRDLFAQ